MLELRSFVVARCQITPLPKNQSLFSVWWRSITGGRSHSSNVEAAKFCRSKVTDNASTKPVTFLDLMSAWAYLQFQCCSCKISSQQSVRQCISLKPVLNWANVCSLNILRTLRRTMIRFLIELLVHRIWFGQSKLYFILNWLVMRCKLRPELAADAQQTAWSKM